MKTPRTEAHIKELQRDPEISGCNRTLEFARKLERELAKVTAERDKLKSALEAADECLALIEDVGHGAMSDNVTVARSIVLAALSQNTQDSQP